MDTSALINDNNLEHLKAPSDNPPLSVDTSKVTTTKAPMSENTAAVIFGAGKGDWVDNTFTDIDGDI